MFNFDLKRVQWRNELEATLAFMPEEIAELDDHLQLAFEKQRSAGQAPESAWNYALASLGSPNALALEFTKNKLLPALGRLFIAWSGPLLLLGLCIGINIFSFYATLSGAAEFQPLRWISAYWQWVGFWACVFGAFAIILLQLSESLRRAMIAGVGNALALIPILYSLMYNSLAESIVGPGWIGQGVTFVLWQIALGIVGLVVTNLWWRRRPITRQAMELMACLVLLLAVAPFLGDCLCNLSLRSYFDLPDRTVFTGDVLKQYTTWSFLYILMPAVVFVVNVTALAIAVTASLGVICTQVSTRNTVTEVTCFPSPECSPWFFTLITSGFVWGWGWLIDGTLAKNVNACVFVFINNGGHVGVIFATLEPATLLSAGLFLICQYELAKKLSASKAIRPFYSWLIVGIEFGIAGALSSEAIANSLTRFSPEPLLLSLVLLGCIFALMLWQVRLIRQKLTGPTETSIWRYGGLDLARQGLLSGLCVTVVSLPLMMTAVACAFSSTTAISTAIAYGKFIQHSHDFQSPKMIMLNHLETWLVFSVVDIAWCMSAGLGFVILVSGLEFIRFNVWRLYKGRLIARLVELEKRTASTPRTASVD